MKIKDIAIRYNLDQNSLQTFLWHFQTEIKYNGNIIADRDVEKAVRLFREYELANNEEAQRSAKEEAEMQKACAAMLVTSGFSFDGYTIKKYSGYISGDDAIQINRNDLFKNGGKSLTDSLVLIRIQALKELKEAAYDLGCNAVIGVDFDYMTFEPETISGTTHYYEPYVICVTANGNAVVIEKNS